MEQLAVGIYRTVFPSYSETFIIEQIRSLSTYRPVLIVRDLLSPQDHLSIITIARDYRFIKRVGFSALGLVGGFNNSKSQCELHLIHAHFAPDAVLVLPLAEKLQVPLVVTCHGSDVTVSNRYIFSSLKLAGFRFLLGRNRLFRKTAIFIAVSDFLKKKMIAAGYPKDKLIRHYVGIDTTRFVPQLNAAETSKDAPYILSIARHTDVKGIDLLLKAFALVLCDHPSIRLVQIGGGPLTKALKGLARTLGIDKSVDFLGPLPSETVLLYLQKCKALVLSSRRSTSGAEEAFGLVLVEASACGVPCVGTRVGGIPEAIVDGETALVEPDNIVDLAEKISLLLSNPKLAVSMGQRGREMACNVFDLHKQTQQLESIYANLLEQSGKERPR